jgi:hypothetical protein
MDLKISLYMGIVRFQWISTKRTQSAVWARAPSRVSLQGTLARESSLTGVYAIPNSGEELERVRWRNWQSLFQLKAHVYRLLWVLSVVGYYHYYRLSAIIIIIGYYQYSLSVYVSWEMLHWYWTMEFRPGDGQRWLELCRWLELELWNTSVFIPVVFGLILGNWV